VKHYETLPADFEAQPVSNGATDNSLELELEGEALPPPLPIEVEGVTDELIQALPPSRFINAANLTEPKVLLR